MKKVSLGFDFGTYTTKVAIYPQVQASGNIRRDPYLVNVNPFSDSSGVIYSFINEQGKKIGKEAYEEYRKGSKDVYYGFKMKLEDKNAYQLAKIFLKKVYEKTLETIKEQGYQLVDVRFSAPNSWITEENERFLQLLHDAGIIEDYKQGRRILEREPYASAIYHIHGEVERAGKKALIIDAGAGTIDTLMVSIKEDGSLDEIKGTYRTIEQAGIFVDKLIKDFYKLKDNWHAEQLKFYISYEFKKGKQEIFHTETKTSVAKDEFKNECLKDWVSSYRELLKTYRRYKPDYILYAGGFSAFYLIEEISREIFPRAEIYPVKDKVKEKGVEFRKDASIAFGCSILAGGSTSVRETLKFNLYIELSSLSRVREVVYKNKKIKFEEIETGKYLIPIFQSSDYVGISVSLRDYKINGKSLSIEQYGVFKLVQEYTNKGIKRTLSLGVEDDRLKGVPLANIEIEVDKNKVLKVIYIDKRGNRTVLTQHELKGDLNYGA